MEYAVLGPNGSQVAHFLGQVRTMDRANALDFLEKCGPNGYMGRQIEAIQANSDQRLPTTVHSSVVKAAHAAQEELRLRAADFPKLSLIILRIFIEQAAYAIAGRHILDQLSYNEILAPFVDHGFDVPEYDNPQL